MGCSGSGHEFGVQILGIAKLRWLQPIRKESGSLARSDAGHTHPRSNYTFFGIWKSELKKMKENHLVKLSIIFRVGLSETVNERLAISWSPYTRVILKVPFCHFFERAAVV